MGTAGFLTQYQVLAEPVLATPEVVTADRWTPKTSVPLFDVKRWQFIYPFSFAPDPVAPDISDTFTKWYRETARPRWDIKRQQFIYPNYFPRHFPVSNAVPQGGGVIIYYRRQFQYPAWAAIDPRQLTLVERTTLDKWFVEHLRQAVRFLATPHLYPYFFFHPVGLENAFSLSSKRNATDFTIEAKNTTDFSTPTKNTTDFTPVSKNTTDFTDP